MEEEAWQKLNEKRSDIQTMLQDAHPRVKVCSKKIPSSNYDPVNPTPSIPKIVTNMSPMIHAAIALAYMTFQFTAGDTPQQTKC